MKKTRISTLLTALLLAAALCFSLASCGKDNGDDKKCTHVDADDNGKCDNCSVDYEDGVDVTPECEHVDADDNGKCDECNEDFSDGDEPAPPPPADDDDPIIPPAGDDDDDEPACTHRDADDNSKCDYCNQPFEDGDDEPACPHRDANDDEACDYCNQPFEDGKEIVVEPAKPEVEDFEDDYEKQDMYWDCTDDRHTGEDAQEAVNLKFSDRVAANLDTSSNVSNVAGATAEVVTDADSGNKYLKLTAPKRISERDRAHSLVLIPEEFVSIDEAYSYVIDLDLFLDGSSVNKTFLTSIWRNTDGKYIQMNITNKADGVYLDGVKIAQWDEWTNIRLEFYPSEPCVVVYSDGLYSGTISTPSSAANDSGNTFDNLATAPINSITFGGSGAEYVVCFDNVSCYYSDVEYSEPCRHKDKNDDLECDKCGEDFDDGIETEITGEVEDFEGDYTTADKTLTYDGAQDSTATDLFFGENVKISYGGNTNIAGSVATVVEESGNKYISIVAPKRLHDRDRTHSITVIPEEAVSIDEAYSYVMEYDVLLDSSALASNFLSMVWYNTAGKYIQFSTKGYEGSVIFGGVNVATVSDTPAWFTLRFEYYPIDSIISVYSNGLYAGAIDISTVSGSDGLLDTLAEAPLRDVSVSPYNAGIDVNVGFDNISCYYSDVEYVEPCKHKDADDDFECDKCGEQFDDGDDPEQPESAKVEDFEGEYDSQEMYWDCTHSAHTGAPEQTATNLIFGDHLSVLYQTSPSYSNMHGASATVETEDDNKYLRLNIPARVGQRDRAHSIIPSVTYVSDDANAYIFEADLRLHSRFDADKGVTLFDALLTFIIYNGVGGTGDFMQITMCNNTDGTNFVSFGGCNLANWDEWFSFRMELSCDDGSIKFYVKDADGVYQYRGAYENIAGEHVSDEVFLGIGATIGQLSMGSSNSKGAIIDIDNIALYMDHTDFIEDEEIVPPTAPTCEHRDADDNEKCDKCGFYFVDEHEVHVDEDHDLTCDNEECDEAVPCEHADEDGNLTCDYCNEPIETEGEEPLPEETPAE